MTLETTPPIAAGVAEREWTMAERPSKARRPSHPPSKEAWGVRPALGNLVGLCLEDHPDRTAYLRIVLDDENTGRSSHGGSVGF